MNEPPPEQPQHQPPEQIPDAAPPQALGIGAGGIEPRHMANTARIALYRGKGFLSALIRWQSRGAYSHAAIAIGDILYESMQGAGCRSRFFDELIDLQNTNVSLFTVEMDIEQQHLVEGFLKRQLGKKYDYTMVARFVTRRQANRRDSGKWFCSELVFAALKEVGIVLFEDTEPWEVSPQMLARSPLLTLYRGNIEPKPA